MMQRTKAPNALVRMARFHELNERIEQAKDAMAKATADQLAAGDTAETNAWSTGDMGNYYSMSLR